MYSRSLGPPLKLVVSDVIDYLAFFFFSSRRRHTRCSRDWSSDVCSSDLLEQLGDASLHRSAFLAVQRRHEAQKPDPGELVVHERPVRNEAEPHLGRDRILMHVVAAQQDAPVRRPEDAGDDAERGGLPGAVRTEESVEQTPGDVQRDVVDGDEAAVVLGQVLQSDHSTSTLMRPIRRTSSACRARPPMVKRTCAAPAGNSSSIRSTATQSPRYTSAHARY